MLLHTIPLPNNYYAQNFFENYLVQPSEMQDWNTAERQPGKLCLSIFNEREFVTFQGTLLFHWTSRIHKNNVLTTLFEISYLVIGAQRFESNLMEK